MQNLILNEKFLPLMRSIKIKEQNQNSKIITVMNIQNLLKRLEKNTTPQRRRILNSEAPYKIKTIQSVGTLNSQPDQIQQSFVIHDTTLHNKSNFSGFSGYSKLDEELSEIDKMKQIYETRQHKSRSKISNHERSNSKSIQKHCLKPSNTPSFSKMTNFGQEKLKMSGCRNLYEEGQEQQQNKPQRKSTFEHIYYKADELDQSYEPCEQSHHLQNSIVKHEQSHHSYQNKKSLVEKDAKMWEQQQEPSLTNNLSNITTPIKNHQCQCQAGFQSLITQKFKEFQKRIYSLEQQNRGIKQMNGILTEKMEAFEEIIQCFTEDKKMLMQQNRKIKQEKDELETILKDVLYRRERQKIMTSKENTHRENQRRQFTNSTNTYTQRKPESTSHEIKSSQPNKNSESKMKVESLLQKLHIKIDRA